MRPCRSDEFGVIWEIINDAAQAYRGVIPEDRWHEPYMPPAGHAPLDCAFQQFRNRKGLLR